MGKWGSGSGEQEKINLLGPMCVSIFSQKTLPVASEEGMELGNGKVRARPNFLPCNFREIQDSVPDQLHCKLLKKPVEVILGLLTGELERNWKMGEVQAQPPYLKAARRRDGESAERQT